MPGTAADVRGYAEIVLWVLEPNARARCFYQALGFRPDGAERVFLEHSDVSLRELRYRREGTESWEVLAVGGQDVAKLPPVPMPLVGKSYRMEYYIRVLDQHGHQHGVGPE